MSGLLAKQVFQELCQDSDENQKTIAEITSLLGEIITIADALLDLKQDIQNRQYNPIISATEQNSTTLEQEYGLLKADYEQRMQTTINLMRTAHLNALNPLFNEILHQSLRNLTGNIQRAHNALFAADNRDQRNRRNSRTNNQSNWCDGCEGCCECCQCCSCDSCEGCGCCEGGGGCCDGCGGCN
jgi:hypothetical protein